MTDRVIIVGAGIGGLTAALLLADKGLSVTVVEKAAEPGGKMRAVPVGDRVIDAGPTVFTMRHVFREIFASIGEDLDDHIGLTKADILARHAWQGGERLDLFADQARSRDAVGKFAGAKEAQGFDTFSAEARRIYEALDAPFIRASKTSPLGLVWRMAPNGLAALSGIKPYEPMWRALGRHFSDGRLRQLFGRYATYAGSSPFHAPATLMLIAHAEAQGVWLIDGGMHRLASVMANLAIVRGAQFRFNTSCTEIAKGSIRLDSGERLSADCIIANCDPAALASGLFGRAVSQAAPVQRPDRRALSAMVTLLLAEAEGEPLSHHNVFFSDDYADEFAQIEAGRLPANPTVYLCAQDRDARDGTPPSRPERFQIIVNAPPNGDGKSFTAAEVATCERATLDRLQACNLKLKIMDHHLTTPQDFNTLFPATGGALYGQATHGALAAFQRPGSRTRIPGLYLAGGATHPGAGVPMAALSGMQAASALLADRASIRRSYPAATHGGISMRSATTGAMD
ncbi:1-hydroxycarotenoid 3,4-desaturase CrtD [Aquisediminimonas profunda]|uniref:1-hydroxycarotenoid 3,4-desaturase CrtD n=1 Tax=Aquisediminimonas profunda TaxID=1550733 RepID=UPI001C629033|nr:1-hydroxycarotenoid 3,4-desaturase CrtD [Aquisediminimonas profunda]